MISGQIDFVIQSFISIFIHINFLHATETYFIAECNFQWTLHVLSYVMTMAQWLFKTLFHTLN